MARPGRDTTRIDAAIDQDLAVERRMDAHEPSSGPSTGPSRIGSRPANTATRKALYQKIGILSSHDWDQAVRALCAEHSWIDESRLAIWGWSGGGAMTLNMRFRYPDLFAAGMSVAPVTDIALYDTIYQERYTGDPRLYPQVYADCSPITFAANLKANLLLVHGTGDDNVHYQNSERLLDELIAHDKHFEFLSQPNRTHSISEGRAHGGIWTARSRTS